MNKPDKHSDAGSILKHVCLLDNICERLLQWHITSTNPAGIMILHICHEENLSAMDKLMVP